MTDHEDPAAWRSALAGILAGLIALLAAAFAPAQQVHFANDGKPGGATPSHFHGWVRRAIDVDVPRTGTIDGVRYVLGNPCGEGLRHIDFRVELAPFEAKTIDLGKLRPDADADATATEPREAPEPVARLPPPPPPLLTVAGRALHVLSAIRNGAGLDVHLRTRVGRMLLVDVWLTLYPGQSWTVARIQTHANNPNVADLTATVPDGFRLEVPGATVIGAELAPAGTTIATWHGRATRWATILWPSPDADAASSAQAAPFISCLAAQRAWPRGNPQWPASNGDPRTWSQTVGQKALQQLDTWDRNEFGIYEDARRTGRDWDWGWPGGELGLGAASLGAKLTNTWIAYGYARRSNPREADGSPLLIGAHPDLALYNDMPHRDGKGRLFSPDGLGKDRNPTKRERHGWESWWEHYYARRLYLAYRQTGDPALQWQIENRAALFLHSRTLDRRLTTTRVGKAREWLWECWEAEQLWHCLADREVAKLVRARAIARFEQLAWPKWGAATLWDLRSNEARFTKDTNRRDNAVMYQQAAAAYATWSLGVTFGQERMRGLGLEGALAVVEGAFSQRDGRWVGWSLVGVEAGTDGKEPELSQLVEGDGASEGPGTTSWMGLAAVVVSQEVPDHPRARAIVGEWIKARRERGQWMAPEALLDSNWR